MKMLLLRTLALGITTLLVRFVHTESCQNCMNGLDSSAGCQPGWYGDNCSSPCDISCKNSTCTVDMGHCLGCPVGFKGEICNETCPQNCDDTGCKMDGSCHACINNSYHGSLCYEQCNQGCSGCFQNNGTCVSCSVGLYGEICDTSCSDKCTNHECDRLGHCKYGCADPHFYGSLCDVKCSDNITNCDECISPHGLPECWTCSEAKFGKNCENDCPENCELCNSSSDCTKCSTGFSGPTCGCKIPNCLECDINGFCAICIDDHFGDQCDVICPGCKLCKSEVLGSYTTCSTCDDGWYLNKPLCFRCPVTCKKCISKNECSECVLGNFGSDCGQTCPKNCLPDSSGEYICDGQTGMCSGDCKDGFYGEFCSLPCIGHCGSSSGRQGCNKWSGECFTCRAGYFGQFCNQSCGNKCAPASGKDMCGRDTGTCANCEPMYYGSKCEKVCPQNCESYCDQETGKCDVCRNGYYGGYCKETCPEHCGPAPNSTKVVCNQLNAECLYCTAGFHGERCQKYCENNCALSGNVLVCKKSDGHCNGCLTGYYDEYCRSTCDNCKDQACDQNTGHCIDGCKKGWFNIMCSERCSTCKAEKCDWLTGVCLIGCVEGLGGQFCKSQIKPEEESLSTVVLGVAVGAAVLMIASLTLVLAATRRRNRDQQARHTPRTLCANTSRQVTMTHRTVTNKQPRKQHNPTFVIAF